MRPFIVVRLIPKLHSPAPSEVITQVANVQFLSTIVKNECPNRKEQRPERPFLYIGCTHFLGRKGQSLVEKCDATLLPKVLDYSFQASSFHGMKEAFCLVIS